jgi:hypothetical protein
MSNTRKTIHKRLEQMHRNSEVSEHDRKYGDPRANAKKDIRRKKYERLQADLRTRQIDALYADMARQQAKPIVGDIHQDEEKAS